MERASFQNTYLKESHVLNRGPIVSTTRSFISSNMISDTGIYSDDLRKSRIQNLPNYKKANLGDNIQFIVVFQSIEIERLSRQTELLRVKLKENERQLFNAQNYEVQIRQLTEKCFAYERQREEYRQEIDNLNKICETLYHENQNLKEKLNENDFSLKQKYESEKQKNSELSQEIDKWKNRYQASEKSKTKELEDLRNLMECQRKSMIDREIREITIRFQTERSNLQNQVRKCREMLENRNRQIEDYKHRCQKLQIQIIELRNYENIIADNQNKIIIINQQLIRLNEVLRNKEDEIQGYRQKEYKLNQQIKQQKDWEYDNKQLKANLENRLKEIDEWKVRVSRLQEDATRGRELSLFNNELSNKLALTSQQIQRLNNVLKGKLDEIQQWKRRLSEKELQVSRYKNLQNDIAQYDSKMNMLKAENDRINGILKSRLGEIEDWRSRYSKLESSLNNLSTVEKEKKTVQGRYNDQIKNNQELKSLVGKLQLDIKNFRDLENRHKDLQNKNGSLSRQVERLNNLLRNAGNELNDLRTRFANTESKMNEYRSIEVKLKDYENKIALLTQQIQRLNTLNRDKSADIDALQKQKLQLHTKMTFYKNYEIKINQNEQMVTQLNNQIRNLKNDIEVWKQKFSEADSRCREKDNQIFVTSQEKDKFANVVRSKNNQNDELRSRYNQLEGELRKFNELQIACQQQHNQISAYLSDIDHYQKKNSDLQRQLSHEKQLNADIGAKVLVLSAEIQRLHKEGVSATGAKKRQLEEMKQNFTRVQSKMKSKQNQIDILMNKINHLETKISNLTKDFMRLLAEAEKAQSQNQSLSKKIEEYQDYARRIHILGAEIDRLNSLNHGLEDDIKKMRLRYSDQMSHQKKLQGFNLTTVLMATEIQSLRSRIQQKNITAEQMRKSILQPVRRI